MAKRRRLTLVERPLMPEGRAYAGSCVLFRLSGFWPVSRAQRPHGARGYDGCPKVPPDPPRTISNAELQRAKRELEQCGFTIIWAPAIGWWKACRTI